MDLGYYGFLNKKNSKAFCEGLSKNNSIQTLFLNSVNLKRFYEDFFKVLKNNTSITNLDISDNYLSRLENEQLIFDAISENETLLEIDLSRCFNSDYNFGSLANAFSKNKSIQIIKFLENGNDDYTCPYDFQSEIIEMKNIIKFETEEDNDESHLELNRFLSKARRSNYILLLSILSRL